MTQIEFADFLERICEYFGSRRLMSEKRIALFYAQCRHVPAEALGWIEERIFFELDSMPRNLPKHIKALWLQWQEAHSDRMVREHIDCDALGCHDGVIFVRDPQGHSSVVFCDRCARQRRIVPPDGHVSNAAEMIVRGWQPDWYLTDDDERRISEILARKQAGHNQGDGKQG